MPEIVLLMASTVVGGTSFWIRLTSNGSISCIRLVRTDFLEGVGLEPKASWKGEASKLLEEKARRGVLGNFLGFEEEIERREGKEREEGKRKGKGFAIEGDWEEKKGGGR